MAELAMFVIERNEDQVEIRLVPIPEGPDDEDGLADITGISFSRRHALWYALKIIKVALSRRNPDG